jgi:hypothetical protein
VRCLQRWGLPRSIKVDNGKPFGDPQGGSVPELALWLIGLGIEVVWSRPHTPRDNASVERMQRTTAQWSEPARCCTPAQLQKRLDAAALIQREKYTLRRQGGKSRRQIYPSLRSNPRIYQSRGFDIEKVYEYLKKKVFTRKVSKNGYFSFYAQSVYVGTAFKNQSLNLRLDPQKMHWKIVDDTNQAIGTFQADNFCEKRIRQLNVCQNKILKVSKLIVANQ